MKPSEIVVISNSTWQNHKERPIRSTNIGSMTERAKRHGVRELVCNNFVIRERLSL